MGRHELALISDSHIKKFKESKKNHLRYSQVIFLIGCVLLSQEAALQVLTAMQGLTSVFGMGTGVSPTLLQPY